MTKLTLTVFFLIVSKLLTAQLHEGSISGTVADGGDQKIIDAATVSLLEQKIQRCLKLISPTKRGILLLKMFRMENIIYWLHPPGTCKHIAQYWKSPIIHPFPWVFCN